MVTFSLLRRTSVFGRVLFTKSAPKPIQSTSWNVHKSVCLFGTNVANVNDKDDIIGESEQIQLIKYASKCSGAPSQRQGISLHWPAGEHI